MGAKRAKIITKTAFEKAFVEAEILMRKALSDMIEKEVRVETNPATIAGLRKAQKIIIGEKIES